MFAHSCGRRVRARALRSTAIRVQCDPRSKRFRPRAAAPAPASVGPQAARQVAAIGYEVVQGLDLEWPDHRPGLDPENRGFSLFIQNWLQAESSVPLEAVKRRHGLTVFDGSGWHVRRSLCHEPRFGVLNREERPGCLREIALTTPHEAVITKVPGSPGQSSHEKNIHSREHCHLHPGVPRLWHRPGDVQRDLDEAEEQNRTGYHDDHYDRQRDVSRRTVSNQLNLYLFLL